MNDTDKCLFMSADEYDECYKAVRQMEKELNIKFDADEFDKMMLMLHDPSFTVELD